MSSKKWVALLNNAASLICQRCRFLNAVEMLYPPSRRRRQDVAPRPNPVVARLDTMEPRLLMSATSFDDVAAFGQQRVELGFQAAVDGGALASDGGVTLQTQAQSDSVFAGGSINLGFQAQVQGDLVADGSFSQNSSTVDGSISTGGSPVAYDGLDLPEASSFSTDGTNDRLGNFNEAFELPAGAYGDLRVGGQGTVTFSAGTYTFDRFDADFGSNVVFDVSAGDIEIFVRQQTQIAGEVDATVIGGDAGDVYLESQGFYRLGFGSDWVGTVYTPTDNLTLSGNNDVTGALYSGADLVLQGQARLDFVSSDLLSDSAPSAAPPVAADLDIEPPELSLVATEGVGVGLSVTDDNGLSSVTLAIQTTSGDTVATTADLTGQLSASGALVIDAAELDAQLGLTIAPGDYNLILSATDLEGNGAVVSAAYTVTDGSGALSSGNGCLLYTSPSPRDS